MTFTFKIKGLPKMSNDLNIHWRSRHSNIKKWKGLVVLECRALKIPKMTKAKLTLTRHSSKEPDFDGLVSGMKSVIDGLVEAGVLENDKVSNIGQPVYLWRHVKAGLGFIEVTIEEVSNEGVA